MLGSTHLLIGTAGVIAYVSMTGEPQDASVYLAALGGSLLPDIDHARSMLGHYYWWMPRPGGLGHRKFTHSIWFLGGLAWVLWSFYGWAPWVLALLWGMISHLLSDVPTDRGVPLLYPVKKQSFCIPIMSSGGVIEKLLMTGLAIWVLVGGIVAHNGGCLLPGNLCGGAAFLGWFR